MSTPIHFSRLVLRRDAPDIAPLLQVLQPSRSSDRLSVDHQLLWTIVPQDIRTEVEGDRANGTPRTAFLWRSDHIKGRYYVLGPKPVDSPFFDIETKPFEPMLSPGDRLAFDLRLNATVDRKIGANDKGKAIRKRCDVAMDLLRDEEKRHGASFNRSERRLPIAEKAVYDWLEQRAGEYGFCIDTLKLEGYRAEKFARRKGKFGTLGIFDLKGTLTVSEPDAFIARLRAGFGRGKAFGCGLMLVRRIHR